MKHHGKARTAAAKLLTLTVACVVIAAGIAGWIWPGGPVLPSIMGGIGLVFVGFILWFFRDPHPNVPPGPGLIVAPAHGLVDVVDLTAWPGPGGGTCHRVSIFLSVFDIHVQQAPIAGTIESVRHTPGLFLNALKTESAAHNENVLILVTSAENPAITMGVRLIAGLIARRIIPWISHGERVDRGERISLIQFGSRVDLYLPLNVQPQVTVGQRVVGGETILGRFPTTS